MSFPKSECDVLTALSSARLVVQLAQEKGVVRHNLSYRGMRFADPLVRSMTGGCKADFGPTG
jgi:hypothetical protein